MKRNKLTRKGEFIEKCWFFWIGVNFRKWQIHVKIFYVPTFLFENFFVFKSFFAPDSTLVCGWRLEHAKHITAHVEEETLLEDVLVFRKHSFQKYRKILKTCFLVTYSRIFVLNESLKPPALYNDLRISHAHMRSWLVSLISLLMILSKQNSFYDVTYYFGIWKE